MQNRNFLTANLLRILLAAVLLLNACANNPSDPDDDNATAPPLPPITSMLMDFRLATDSTAAPITGGDEFSKTRANWRWAALNVGVWNVAITITMALPVAAFLESFKHQPVRQSDGSWLWTYTVVIAPHTYTCRLQATAANNMVDWQMLVSRQGGFTDRRWFYGSSDLLSTNGSWTLNRPEVAQETPFVRADWQRDLQVVDRGIKYTIVEPGNAGNGSYIEYGVTSSGDYDLYYNLFNVANSNITEIEWNSLNLAHFGRVMDPVHFGDTDWHCWDSTLEDTTCP